MLEVVEIKPLIGSELHADVAPLVDGQFSDELRSLLRERGVLVFRDLSITPEQQRDITASFGPIRGASDRNGLQKVSDDANIAPELAGYLNTTFFWHFDGHIAQTVPCFGGSFRPISLPIKGGETQFLSAYAAYNGLEAAIQCLVDGLNVVHTVATAGLAGTPDADDDLLAQWRSVPPATQPLVWKHADGRKSLMLAPSISHVVGMHPADSLDLLSKLRIHILREEYIYTHIWRKDDLVIWDNTGTLHRARPYQACSGRLLHRFTLEGSEPIQSPL